VKNLTDFSYATAAASGLPAAVVRAFTEGETGPLTYALGVLTGFSGYPALPVVVSAGTAGLAVTDFNGYYVAGIAPLGAAYPTGTRTYYAALALLRALPTRLTVSALSAAGADFSLTGISPGPVPAGTPTVAGSLRPFTASDWVGLAGASSAPNGNPPLIADAYPNADGAYAPTVIADATGVAVIFYPNADGDSVEFYLTLAPAGTPSNTAYALAVAVAGGLPATLATLTPAYLTALGFSGVGPAAADFEGNYVTGVRP